MSTADLSAACAPPRMSTRALLGAYRGEIVGECLRYLRSPAFVLPSLLFPCVFYLMFAVLLNRHGGVEVGRYMLSAYLVFGIMGPGLFGFGVALANDRENGLLTLKRALPMPPAAHLLAKAVMAMMMATIIAALLLALGVGLAKVPLTAMQLLQLLVLAPLGALPFCALGTLIGSLAKGSAAAAIVNLVYLPMAFLSGLWVPLAALPALFARVAMLSPAWHLHQLALQAAGLSSAGSSLVHLLMLVTFSALMLVLAAYRLRRHG